MILPSKHIPQEQTLLGIGAVLLSELGYPQTPTNIWEKVRLHPSVGTFERFVLALDFLHIVGVVALEGGMLKRSGT